MLYAALSLAARMMGAQRRPLAERSNMIQIPPVPEGIADPKDLCNGVYNEDYELQNLAWSNRRLHASLAYILRMSGARVAGWASIVNQGANGAPSLRTSTLARLVNPNGTYHDADVRNIYRTPLSVVYALFEIANPGASMPQIQPFVFEAEDAGPSPVGEQITPSRMPFPTWRNIGTGVKAGDRYTAKNGDEYEAMTIILSMGFFGQGAVTEIVWKKAYLR